MPYQAIDFVSQSRIQQMQGRDDTIVISIRSSGSDQSPARIAPGFKDVLFLVFDNVEHLCNHAVRFSRDQGEEILAFVAKNEGQATRILVNCMMGETRSAAVAQYLSEKYSLPLDRSTKYMSKWVYHVLDYLGEREVTLVKPDTVKA